MKYRLKMKMIVKQKGLLSEHLSEGLNCVQIYALSWPLRVVLKCFVSGAYSQQNISCLSVRCRHKRIHGISSYLILVLIL
jgi:hypothetical protein